MKIAGGKKAWILEMKLTPEIEAEHLETIDKMTTPTTPRQAPEAVEAALEKKIFTLVRNSLEDEITIHDLEEKCSMLTCELGHYKELLESIKNLCEGTGVGLREDVMDILKKM